MGTISITLPTIGEPNSTEDADVRAALSTIVTEINGNLDNNNVKAAAGIAFNKLAALTSTQILVGNGSNVATAVALSGDATLSNAGVLTLAANAADSDVVDITASGNNASATIALTTTNQLITGCSYTAPATGTYLCIGTFSFEVTSSTSNGATQVARGRCQVNAVSQTGSANLGCQS
jgi:hypothetical protein